MEGFMKTVMKTVMVGKRIKTPSPPVKHQLRMLASFETPPTGS
jgi:hypothetical protein